MPTQLNLVGMVTLTAVLLPLVFSQQQYCEFSYKHTMCSTQTPGPACNGNILRRGVSSEEKQIILNTHNRLRAIIARGEEKRGAPGPQPPASNMKILEWDEELATIAQRHADQCVFAHDCSDCRKVNRFGVGQNLYISKQSLRLPDNNWKQGITNWYDEVSLFSRTKVEPFQFAASYGHYSQLVWADTHKIGCGLSSYREGKWFASLYTCNYGPNGNFIKGQMYKQGSGCSECSGNETCSIDFPGLCEPRSSAFTPPRPTFVPTPKPSVQTEKPFIITNPEPTPKPTPRPTPPPTPRPTPKPFQTPRFIPTSSPVLNPVFTPKFAPVPNTGLKNFAPTSNRFIPQSVRTTEQPSFKPAAR
ncbi:venom allergen 3 [Eurytemora carolleeae]|uniref:venom allergen 3 n=1 Tax=Eurytemora carolleeae TaxID=1294199 RepID=UPI000C76736F|nr:venom allergen 3 [Eurytemora carolleeae]|eukprot:XP_023321440.1 venom allergen 3-like [Eurytemora affinis]